MRKWAGTVAFRNRTHWEHPLGVVVEASNIGHAMKRAVEQALSRRSKLGRRPIFEVSLSFHSQPVEKKVKGDELPAQPA